LVANLSGYFDKKEGVEKYEKAVILNCQPYQLRSNCTRGKGGVTTSVEDLADIS